jgi:hypothetical protein
VTWWAAGRRARELAVAFRGLDGWGGCLRVGCGDFTARTCGPDLAVEESSTARWCIVDGVL